jgi:intein/homing endonuclease
MPLNPRVDAGRLGASAPGVLPRRPAVWLGLAVAALSAGPLGRGLVQGAKAKRVPGWVFGLHRELRLAFLAGLIDTDGSIDRRGTLKIQLANRPLVEDVKALLVGCGIQTSNLYHQVFDAAVLPNPGSKDQYESWAIVCSSAEEVATIPFADSLYRTRVQANAGRRRRGGKDAAKAGLDGCLGFYTVRSIVSEVVEPVYGLEVAGGQAFIADGLVVQPGHL